MDSPLVEILLHPFNQPLLLATVFFAMTSAQRSSRSVEIKAAAQQDVRAVLESMALEIAMASYNPTFQPAFWRDPTDCNALAAGASTPPPNQSSRGIQLAAPNSLSIQMDLDGNSRIFQAAFQTEDQMK
jgi:hypothetical protein